VILDYGKPRHRATAPPQPSSAETEIWMQLLPNRRVASSGRAQTTAMRDDEWVLQRLEDLDDGCVVGGLGTLLGPHQLGRTPSIAASACSCCASIQPNIEVHRDRDAQRVRASSARSSHDVRVPDTTGSVRSTRDGRSGQPMDVLRESSAWLALHHPANPACRCRSQWWLPGREVSGAA